MAHVSGPGNWLRDSSDYIPTQLVVGAVVGYAAGLTDALEEKLALGGALFAYRLAHHLGYFELNLTRTSMDRIKEKGKTRKHNQALDHTVKCFARENVATLGGFAAGYVLAHCNLPEAINSFDPAATAAPDAAVATSSTVHGGST
jgi:hypothetical protein